MQKWRSALATTFLTWRSARAPSSPAGRRTLRRSPSTSWLQGATTCPLPQRWTLLATLTRLVGLSRALGFPLARGLWRGKTFTAVRLSLASRAYAPSRIQLLCALTYTDLPHSRFFHRADGLLQYPQRRPYLLSPYSISRVAQSALHATHYWLTAVILRVGNSLFSASSGMENVGVSSSQWATNHESRVLDGRHDYVGGHLPRRMLDFGVDSDESAGGTLKEE